MSLSGDPTLSELIAHLDYVLRCVRCGTQVAPEEGAVVTPWTVETPPVRSCIGVHVTFLCGACRAANASVAQDIVNIEARSDNVVIEDDGAFK